MSYVKYEISDDDLLAAVRQWGNRTMTYVVRNILSKGRPNLGTPQIHRQLKRVEREGKVERVATSYARQICWSAT